MNARTNQMNCLVGFAVMVVVAILTAPAAMAELIYSEGFESLNQATLLGQDGWADYPAMGDLDVTAFTGGFLPGNTQAATPAANTGATGYYRNRRVLPGGPYDASNVKSVTVTFDAIQGSELSAELGSSATGWIMAETNGPGTQILIQNLAQGEYARINAGSDSYRFQMTIDFVNETITGLWDSDAADVLAGVYDGNDGGSPLLPYNGSFGSGTDSVNDGTLNVGGSLPPFAWTPGFTIDTIMLKARDNNGALGAIDNVLVTFVPIPEPTSLALLAAGALLMLRRRR